MLRDVYTGIRFCRFVCDKPVHLIFTKQLTADVLKLYLKYLKYVFMSRLLAWSSIRGLSIVPSKFISSFSWQADVVEQGNAKKLFI